MTGWHNFDAQNNRKTNIKTSANDMKDCKTKGISIPVLQDGHDAT